MNNPDTPEAVARLFAATDGSYRFARWGRPIVPVIFGVDDDTVALFKGAIEAVVAMAGHKMAETDPELGANLMFFFIRDWRELTELDHLDEMIPDLAGLVERLIAADANQYRLFRFDTGGAIQASFVFLRMTGALADVPADELALNQIVRVILLWGDRAFEQSPLALLEGQSVLKPGIADVIRAAYDPVMPAVAGDDSHALRLFARLGARA